MGLEFGSNKPSSKDKRARQPMFGFSRAETPALAAKLYNVLVRAQEKLQIAEDRRKKTSEQNS